MNNHYVLKYLQYSTTFGTAYKLWHIWDAHVETPTKIGLRPLFLGEKIFATTLGIVYSPVLAPYWVLRCVDCIDMSLRGKTPEYYGYDTMRKSVIDYIFM